MNRRDFLRSTSAAAVLYGLPLSWMNELGFAQSVIDKMNESFRNSQLTVTPVRENLWMIGGIGGNIGVLVNNGDALLIDSGSHVRSQDLLDKVHTLGGKNISALINTHWHFDHTDGNQNLARAGAKVTAHENTKKRLSSPQPMEILNFTFPPSPPEALPTSTFADSTTVKHGPENLHLTYFPDAHTDTDAIVQFEQANVIHSGDLVFNGFYPLIDFSTKGWIGGQAAGAQRIAELAKQDTKIIPGHGPLADRKQVQEFADMLKRVHDRLEPMMQQGKTIAEVVASKPTSDLDERWGNGSRKGDGFTEMAYKGLLRHYGKPFA